MNVVNVEQMLGMKIGLVVLCAVTVSVGVALYSANSRTFDDRSVVETSSPQGTYTVLFELKPGEANALGWSTVVEIFYGKHERFLIFDLEPQVTLTLPASPQVSNNLPPAATVIYEATNFSTQRKRTKMIENLQRKDASEGPLKSVVEILDD